MENSDLKKLSRRDLIDIIYQMKKNEQKLEEEISTLKESLEARRLHISNAGSVADAAAAITDILSVAQNTADIYLEEIACMKEEADAECKKIIEEANKTVEKILYDGKKKYNILKEHYQVDYQKWQQLREDIKNDKRS